MFERFTDRARRVVVLAQEEARRLSHDYIGTEHILLGLIYEGEGVAAQALERLGISPEAVRARVEVIVGQGKHSPTGHIPFTPRAKKVLELSLREALQLGHSYIGTEHLLLGLIREGEGVASQVLQQLGADLNRVRQQVILLLSAFPGRGPTSSAHQRPLVSDHTRIFTILAGQEARRLGHAYLGTEHLLLAHLAVGDSVSFQVLTSLGVTYEAARECVVQTVGQGAGGQPDPAHLPMTPRARSTIELAVREALQRGRNDVGTRHLLLAMVPEGEGQLRHGLSTALKVLEQLGVDGPTLRRATLTALAVYDRTAKGVPPSTPMISGGVGRRDQPSTFAILRFLTPEELASTPSLQGGAYDEEAWSVVSQDPLTYVCPRCGSLIAGDIPGGEHAHKDGRLLHLEAVHQPRGSVERRAEAW